MKVLITGATGFVGGAVTRRLARRDYEVSALVRPRPHVEDSLPAGVQRVEGDLLDPASLRRAVRDVQGIFHVAANYTFWARDPDHIYRPNVEGTRHLLEAARAEGVQRFLFTSSVGTLRAPQAGGTIDETSHATPEELPDHYHRSKLMAERLVLSEAGRGMEVVVVNPTTPVGEGDVRPTPTGRIILEYFRPPVAAYVDGRLNIVDVNDVAYGHVAAFERGRPGHRYLLGCVNTSIVGVFQLLAEATGVRRRAIRLPYWLVAGAGYADHFLEGTLLQRPPFIPLHGLRALRQPMHVDCAKAARDLGYAPSPVIRALERSVRWFAEHGYIPQARLSARHPAGSEL